MLTANLECKVKCLLWEVSDDAGKVSSPEAGDALVSVGPDHTVPHPAVALVQPALL